MQMTTNGGLNWIVQTLPQGGNIITSSIYKFSNVNADTIWGAGGWIYFPGNGNRGIIYRTTNGGNNWYFQLPDTSIHTFQFYQIKFINKLNGWAYTTLSDIHTITGGNDTFYTSVNQISTNTPDHYILYQNYPNPFNPSTTIKFQLSAAGNVVIRVYDIQGRSLMPLVKLYHYAGVYEYEFSPSVLGLNLSSGIYFYRMSVDDKFIDTKKMILLK